MIYAVVFITIESHYKLILNHSKNQTCLSLHHIMSRNRPSPSVTLLYCTARTISMHEVLSLQHCC